MSAFVVRDRYSVVLRTDDWVEAQRVAMTGHYHEIPRRDLSVEGVHPTHAFPSPRVYNGRCANCAAWDNGSYGSQAPCGYDFDGALVTVIERESAKCGIAWSWRRRESS